MKEFKKIAVAIVVFCVCFLILDWGIGGFFDWAIKQMPSEGERVAKSEYVINKVDADFIVIGSSRAEAHYDSKVIQKSFPEYSVFNCGVDGQSFCYTNTAFNCIMDRYSPKVVVWDFLLTDLVEDNPENLSLLFPYYYQNEYVKSVLDVQDLTLKYKLWNNCYRYNGTASRILRAMRIPEQGKMGFSAHATADASRKFISKDYVDKSDVLIKSKVEMLESTLNRAKEKGITVVLSVSPYYVNVIGNSMTLNYLEDLADRYGFQCVDASQWEEFLRNDKYWYDTFHLNASGAEMFTKKFIESLTRQCK